MINGKSYKKTGISFIQKGRSNKEFKKHLIFYFLTRTCYNGTIRYNGKGEFNTSHHFGRTGMLPKKVEEVISYSSELMRGKDIDFACSSFENISPIDNKKHCLFQPHHIRIPKRYILAIYPLTVFCLG